MKPYKRDGFLQIKVGGLKHRKKKVDVGCLASDNALNMGRLNSEQPGDEGKELPKEKWL